MFTITVTTAKGETRAIPFPGDAASIGKGEDNAVQLKGWTIGKKHASLVRRDGQLFVEDHGGLSVTEVNGKAIDERYGPLQEDDVIQIGGYEIRVTAGGEGGARPQAAGASSIEDLLSATLSRPIPAYQPKPLSPDAPLRTQGGERAPAPPPIVTAAPAPARAPAPQAARAPVAAAPAPAAAPAFDPDMTTRTQARVQTDARVARMNKARQMVHTKLISVMDLRRVDVSRMEEQELRTTTSELIREIISEARDLPPDLDHENLAKQVLDEVVGLGPLEELLADDAVTEIMVNRYDEIFIERGGKLAESEITFTSDNAVLQAIERIVAPLGRRIDESSPMVDARLKDGSRVNAVIPPLALKGCNITIRKFAKNKLQDSDLVKYGSVTADMMSFLKVAVEHGTNIIISGGTGSGKTTLLNVLSNYIPDDERIVTVEDAAELKLSQPNLVSLEARPANVEGKGAIHIRDLVKNCLRMRPDRIVVGECRGGEALDMLQAMNTGHDGSLTTAHANTPRDCIARLEVMVLMSGLDLPVQAIREQISSAVHLIVQQNRFPDGSRKVTHVTEITGIEGGVIQMQDIFLFRQEGYGPDGRIRGRFVATGAIPDLYQSLSERGIPVDLSIFQKDREL